MGLYRFDSRQSRLHGSSPAVHVCCQGEIRAFAVLLMPISDSDLNSAARIATPDTLILVRVAVQRLYL